MGRAYKKKEKTVHTPTKGNNALNDPEEQRRFRMVLDLIVESERKIADERELISETIKDLYQLYGLEKPVIRQMVRALMKHNYSDVRQKNKTFEEAYEMIIEGGFRDDILDDEDTL
jgi:uncharacterized protein YjgD (DUF1641 family)